ncbi:hypothetical protein ANANG_G00083840 [Anguilla anguilla]|uniref:Uncharacterized protein n=1 Tax=Anguilla anguilla TaxID=7936 RepID=A0A9D3MMI5_ANGAN|nr:hypothetical protein ANANG_G00083840 [Anguilla anguilla]
MLPGEGDQEKIEVLRKKLKRHKRIADSTKQENKELKACTAQCLRTEEENNELKDKMELVKKTFETNRKSLEEKLEITTNQLREKEQALQQKLAQERELQERETKFQSQIRAGEITIKTMTTEQKRKEECYKTRIKDLEAHFAELGNSLSSSEADEVLKASLKAHSRN